MKSFEDILVNSITRRWDGCKMEKKIYSLPMEQRWVYNSSLNYKIEIRYNVFDYIVHEKPPFFT